MAGGLTYFAITYPLNPKKVGVGLDEVKLNVVLTEPASQEFFEQLVPLAEAVEALAEWLNARREDD